LVDVAGIVFFIICHCQWLFKAAADGGPHFGCDDDVVPAPSVFLDRFAEDFFGKAIGIGVCGVEVEAGFVAMVQHW
jgi:hypothetical protein